MRTVNVLCLICLAGSATAGPVLNFDEGTGSRFFGYDQTVGWQFDVLSSITVTHLSWYDFGGDGLSTAHQVGIWSPSGVLLTSVVVPAGTAAAFDGQWRIMPVTPFNLVHGTGYIVGGFAGDGSLDLLAAHATQYVDPSIRYIVPMLSPYNTGFQRPTLENPKAETGYYGPSFNAIPVP